MMVNDFDELRHLIYENPKGLENESLAASNLLKCFDGLVEELARVNVESLVDEFKGLAIGRDIDSLSRQEIDRACELDSMLDKYNQLEQLRSDAFASLKALSILVQDLERKAVIDIIQPLEWITQHEVLTRWGWMRSQKEKVNKGNVKFNHLYECKVGRKRGRQNIDREFHTLLQFIPQYCNQVGQKFLYYEKGETPDFVVEDNQGRKMGIEVTEGPLNTKSSFEEKEKEAFLDGLEDELQGISCLISIWERPKWSLLNRHFGDLKTSLASKIRSALPNMIPKEDHFIELYSPSFRISLNHFNQFLVFDLSGDGTGKGYYGNQPEILYASAMCDAISNKLSSAKAPSIRPCILAIHSNTGLPNVDYPMVTSLVAGNIPSSDVSSHFDGIYVTLVGDCVRLL